MQGKVEGTRSPIRWTDRVKSATGNPVLDYARQATNGEMVWDREESSIHPQYKYGRLNVTTIEKIKLQLPVKT